MQGTSLDEPGHDASKELCLAKRSRAASPHVSAAWPKFAGALQTQREFAPIPAH
jgi:hypothetical protein